MIDVVDYAGALEGLVALKGRTPGSTEAERAGAFARLLDYRDGGVFLAKFAGTSAWERHPQGDEIVHIVAGETTLRLMTDAGCESLSLKAGMMTIVPRNMWHQFVAPGGVSVMTVTPQPTEHLRVDVDDPRTATAQA